eukprot:PITA_06567
MKNVEFKWTNSCQKAFEELKHKLSTAPILRGPDWNLPFHISSDAFDIAIGAVLGQEENHLPYAIYFITIKYLMNKSVTNARVTRWLLLLQEFDITIVDRPGKENVVADFLSRLKTDNDIPVDDSFPDEYLFAVSAHSPWYADIANYLVAGKLPSHLSYREKRRIVQQSASCQRMGQPNHRDQMPLNPQVISEPFERWALDFIGPINPPSNQRTYILVCTDYMTKWVEAKALIRANEEVVLAFLFEEIFTRFGTPRELVTDGGPPFNSHGFKSTLHKYHIQHRMTTPYHPQANGQVESTNKVLEAILTKTVKDNRKDWSQRLPEALWAYRTTWRNTTGFSPYELVYGKNAIFPVEFEIKTLRTALAVNLDLTDVQTARLQQLLELDEKRLDAIHQTNMIQQQRMKWHDKITKHKQFQKGNWALLYDSRFENFQGKLRTRWLGPYEVDDVFPNGTVRLLTIDDAKTPLLVNGHRLRLYQRPVSKEDFKLPA